MIEQQAVARKHSICFAVIHRSPMSKKLCHGIGRSRVKRRALPLRRFPDQTEEFRGRCLIKPGSRFQAQEPDGFKNSQRAERVDIGGIFRSLEAHSNVALSAEVIDFVRFNLTDDPREVRAIRQISVMQTQIGSGS